MFGQSSRNNPPPSTAGGRKRLTGRDWKIPNKGRLQLLSNKAGRKGSLGANDAGQRGVVRRPRTGLAATTNSGGLTSAATGSSNSGRLFSLSNTSGSGSSQRFGPRSANTPAAVLSKSSRVKETTSLSKTASGSAFKFDGPGLITTRATLCRSNGDVGGSGAIPRRTSPWQPPTTKPGTAPHSLPTTLTRQTAQSRETTVCTKLRNGQIAIPHPAKGNVGEDAHFCIDNAVGVADGVGGWAAHGIDAGEYARQLVGHMKNAFEAGTKDPVEIMWHAYNSTATLGSSTALVLVLDSKTSTVETANLGDSAFRHIRDGAVFVKSKTGQHYFNCPFQLGSHSGDDPSDSLCQVSKVLVGDVFVCGSDGLFDNLFDSEILALIEKHGDDLDSAASSIGHAAQRAATQMHRQGPFAQEAAQNGISFQGGKLDDITCVVSKVVPME